MTNITKYVALLGACMAANTGMLQANPKTDAVSSQVIMADADSSYDASSDVINFNVYELNQVIYCSFRTEYKCKSYVIEGKQEGGDEFRSLFYCNDELCVDSREWVDINFSNNDYPYQYFRIKTVTAGGDVKYSQVQFVKVKPLNDVEIINNVVAGNLYFRFNTIGQPAFRYSIASINGDLVKNEESAAEGFSNLEALSPGFYIISFKAGNGKTYHYKFLKTANL
jgi:hypothetical protein